MKIQVRECSLGAGTGLSPDTQAETRVDKVALQELSHFCLVTVGRPTMIKLGRPSCVLETEVGVGRGRVVRWAEWHRPQGIQTGMPGGTLGVT